MEEKQGLNLEDSGEEWEIKDDIANQQSKVGKEKQKTQRKMFLSTHARNVKNHINLKRESALARFFLNKMAKSKPVGAKKKFFPITIPLLNREVEAYSYDIKSLDKKTINFDLTHDLRGKALDLKLLINTTEKEATTTPIQISMIASYIRRMTRKGTDYSEDSIKLKCKDNEIRIKYLLITRKRVTRKVLSDLRKQTNIYLENYVKDKTFEHLILDIINGKLQKEMMVMLKKIYPLSLCEIKFLGKENNLEQTEKRKKSKKEKTEDDTTDTNPDQA